MAEHSPFILPVASGVRTNCYPLQRKEAYEFDDGSRLERDIRYGYTMAEERFIDDEGVHYADEDQQRRLCFLNSLVSMSDG